MTLQANRAELMLHCLLFDSEGLISELLSQTFRRTELDLAGQRDLALLDDGRPE